MLYNTLRFYTFKGLITPWGISKTRNGFHINIYFWLETFVWKKMTTEIYFYEWSLQTRQKWLSTSAKKKKKKSRTFFIICDLIIFVCVSTGVIMVYFSGYLIETTGSWASVFALITVVNLLGLGMFLTYAEARRVDLEAMKGRYIHIWAKRNGTNPRF